MRIRPLLQSIALCVPMLVGAAILANDAPETYSPSLVHGNTAFALDLYARLKSQRGNLFCSPYSISSSLAAVYAGARGNTETQMARTLHFLPDQWHAAMGHLRREVHEAGKANGIELILADALWTQAGHPFTLEFLEIVEGEFQANLKQIDFVTEAESARIEVNRWIAQKTREKIRDILPPQTLTSKTKMLLANAAYFRGTWSKPFKKSETRLQPFHLSPGNQVRSAFMHHRDSVRYMENADFQAVELPYGKPGQPFAMLVLLPRQIDGCRALESRFTPAFLQSLAPQFKFQAVDLYIPRFKIDSSFELKSVLTQMGMPDAFTPAADFSGIDGTRLLYLSGVAHKAWCEVNEEGTEAAAATVVGGRPAGMAVSLPPVPVFRADHPFLFLIRDSRSGSILFWGRVADPAG